MSTRKNIEGKIFRDIMELMEYLAKARNNLREINKNKVATIDLESLHDSAFS